MKNDLNYNIELVAPAGSPDALDAAIGEGADAVYLGLRDFNARMWAKNFSYNQFDAIVERLHGMSKKVYVTLNTVFENWEKDRVFPLLKYLEAVGPDAVIVQDMGIIKLINDHFPLLKITASTQLNVGSSKAINFLSKFKVKRVVLPRELNIEDIKTIKQNTTTELEVFSHGALCVSYSGLCLFSSYFCGKSANRGKCSQACRRLYHTPENNKKGYFFSPNDISLLEHIPELIEIGVSSIKLEGRMKSASYVATIVRGYRYLIDNYRENKNDAIEKAKKILESDFAREKTNYFFIDNSNLNYINPDSSGEIGLEIGKIVKVKKIENNPMFLIDTEYDLELGDTIRIHSSKDKKRTTVKIVFIIKSETGNGYFIPTEDGFDLGDSVHLLIKKSEYKKYPHIIPTSLTKYKTHPGISLAPHLKPKKLNAIEQKIFKEGLYIKTNNFNDLFIIQSIKPEKIILKLNRENFTQLQKNINNIPLKKDDIIIYLKPFFPESDEFFLSEAIQFLTDNNFNNFIVNNLGHISILKNHNANLIAGEYLYTFNDFSTGFLIDNGVNFFVTPLENNKKNIFSLAETYNGSRFFVTIFGYPELFRIKADLTKIYDFNSVLDNHDNQFYIKRESDESLIIPEVPFSIIDKIPQLEKIGIKRFIADLSYINLTKNYYKTIFKTIENREIIEKFGRFNYKEGFYREKESLSNERK